MDFGRLNGYSSKLKKNPKPTKQTKPTNQPAPPQQNKKKPQNPTPSQPGNQTKNPPKNTPKPKQHFWFRYLSLHTEESEIYRGQQQNHFNNYRNTANLHKPVTKEPLSSSQTAKCTAFLINSNTFSLVKNQNSIYH